MRSILGVGIAIIAGFWVMAGGAGAAVPRGGVTLADDGLPTLSAQERSSLRFKLENAWNEVDLLVRNAETSRRDNKKQEMRMNALQVLQKIPVATSNAAKFPNLLNALRKSASRFGLTIVEGQPLETSRPDRPVPAVLPSDTESFKLTEDQIVQKVRMDLKVKGTKRQLQDWMDTWAKVRSPEEGKPGQLQPSTPLLEWDPKALTSLPEPVSDSEWKLHVQADLFRDIRFPKIVPRDPIVYLPAWARKNPARFKKQEPLLWSLVEKTRAGIPKALPHFETRGKFQLNSSRMSYFTSKVTQFE